MKTLIIYLLLFLLILLNIQTQVNANDTFCKIEWQPIIQISASQINSIKPQIISNNSSNITIFWFEDGFEDNGGIFYCQSTNRGISFTNPIKLVTYDSCLGMPGYVASQSNIIYYFHITPHDTAYYSMVIKRSTNWGTTWESDKILAHKVIPLTATADSISVYIFFQDELNRIGVLRSDDEGNSWNQTLVPFDISAAVSSVDYIHIVAREFRGSNLEEVIYISSSDKCNSWGNSFDISNQDRISSTLSAISTNHFKNIFISWNDSNTIVFRRSMDNGNTWLPQRIISEIKGAVFSDIASSENFVCIAWDNEFKDSNKILIRLSTNRGHTFCPIDSSLIDQIGGEPQIIISGDQLHIVWSGQNQNNSEIYHRCGKLPESQGLPPPTSYNLNQNFPNPFNGITRITYQLAESSYVNLSVYNILGQKIAIIINNWQPPSYYDIPFNGSELPSGVYFYRLTTKKFSETRKFVIAR